MYIQNRSPVISARDSDFTPPPVPSIPSDASSWISEHLSGTDTSSQSSNTGAPGDSTRSSLSSTRAPSSSSGTPATTGSPSSASSPSSNGSGTVSSSKSGMSPGIIGAIVASSVVAVIAIIFLIRFCYTRRRKAQRAKTPILGWDNKADEKAADNSKPRDSLSINVTSTSGGSTSEGSRWSYHGSAEGANNNNRVSVPVTETRSSWFNSLTQAGPKTPAPLSVIVPKANTASNGTIMSPSSQLSTPMFAVPKVTEAGVPYTLATVQRPFIQTMPDELPATTGQQVGILQQYDDGWTLCVALNGNTTGPQGMVPTECLKRSSVVSSTEGDSIVESKIKTTNRFSKRKSSLFA